jgi:putative tricarboxylic transport membrane protein
VDLTPFVLQRYGYPVAPIEVGLILGPMLETHFRRAQIVSRGDSGIFLRRPIGAALLALAAVYSLAPVVPWVWRRRRVPAVAEG